jgi:hypothetical protein
MWLCRNEATISHRARLRTGGAYSRLQGGQVSMGGIPVGHRRSFFIPGRETDRGGTVSDRAAPAIGLPPFQGIKKFRAGGHNSDRS